MRSSRILLFFMIVLCAFFTANTAFAGYTNWKYSADKGGITVGTGTGVSAIPAHDSYGKSSDIRDMGSGLSLTQAEPLPRYSLLDHSAEMFKVLSVLKKKVKDKRLFEKIAEKLPTLSEERLRIMVSLSDRMSDEGHSAKKDFAFLLLTTLIVFS